MDAEAVDKLIEGWTQAERGAIHNALESLTVGAFKLADTKDTWCIPIKAESIEPKATSVVVGRIHLRLTPSRLVIFEPTVEQIENEEITVFTDETETKTKWWKPSVVKPATTTRRVFQHKSLVTVPRSTWRIRGMFVGAVPQFQTEYDMPGDLFGPEGSLSFRTEFMPGIDLSITVQNMTSLKIPFYAAVIGQLVDESGAQ